MASYTHDGGSSTPRYKSKHVPKLSLLPFEIDAPSSQLSPPLTSEESQYDEHFTPRSSPAVHQESEFMTVGYFSTGDDQMSRNSERKKTSNSKKYTPNNLRFPEFVPHHSRGNSGSSIWAKSSTSSATLAVAESKTVLSYPPRKASQVVVEFSPRKEPGTPGKFTGDRRGTRTPKNYSMPRSTFDGNDGYGYDYTQDPHSIERKDSLANLLPDPLEIKRKQSAGSLRTPLTIPSEDLATIISPPAVHLQRHTSALMIPLDMPRKDSSTLPLTSMNHMSPSRGRLSRNASDKYKSQIMGNPFRLSTSPPDSNSTYEDDKFDIDSWPLPAPAGRKSKMDRFSFLKLNPEIDMTDTASIYTARRATKPYSYFKEAPESKYKKVKRVSGSCWGRWSTRQIILAATAVVLIILFAAGLSTGLLFGRKKSHGPGLTPTWRPAIGNPWQIHLGEQIAAPSLRAQVYNIDMFQNNASNVEMLHKAGRRVICFFSAGSYESWQPDAGKFKNITMGKNFQDSSNATWLDTRATTVRDIMAQRIKHAKDMGCDGVDPDNVDGYLLTGTNGTGFPLTEDTGVDYVRFLAKAAHKLDIAIGLKNSAELINGTLDVLDWSVNENCAKNDECEKYQPFIQAGKPVFHIEYATNASAVVLDMACTANGTQHFSTLLKKASLDAWAVECPYADPTFGAD